MDNRRYTNNSVGARVGQQLHDGRVYSRPPGDCYYRGIDQNHSGAKASVNDLQVLSCRSYIY